MHEPQITILITCKGISFNQILITQTGGDGSFLPSAQPLIHDVCVSAIPNLFFFITPCVPAFWKCHLLRIIPMIFLSLNISYPGGRSVCARLPRVYGSVRWVWGVYILMFESHIFSGNGVSKYNTLGSLKVLKNPNDPISLIMLCFSWAVCAYLELEQDRVWLIMQIKLGDLESEHIVLPLGFKFCHLQILLHFLGMWGGHWIELCQVSS